MQLSWSCRSVVAEQRVLVNRIPFQPRPAKARASTVKPPGKEFSALDGVLSQQCDCPLVSCLSSCHGLVPDLKTANSSRLCCMSMEETPQALQQRTKSQLTGPRNSASSAAHPSCLYDCHISLEAALHLTKSLLCMIPRECAHHSCCAVWVITAHPPVQSHPGFNPTRHQQVWACRCWPACVLHLCMWSF